jgi:DNA-binding MarR family transcriptional regulator
MQELSASVLLSKSGLSRLVDRMVAAGLVRRERCQDDRRGWFAVLTDQGRSALRRAAPVHLRGIQEHFNGHLEPEVVLPAAWVRWDRGSERWFAFVLLACALVCWNRL